MWRISRVLTDDDKTRIRLEEQYRKEVRDELAPKKAGRDKVLDFLNTAFALWLLSAIFLSGVGTLYTGWQKSRDEQRAKVEREAAEAKTRIEQSLAAQRDNNDAIQRLDLEISYRLSSVLVQLNSISEQTRLLPGTADERKLRAASATMGVLVGMSATSRRNEPPLYPEYGNYALPTLLSELRRKLPEPDRDAVERSLASVVGAQGSQNFATDDPAKEAGGFIYKHVLLPRWTGSAFYHVDCSAEMPFC
jgi:hypothetical protein